MTFFVVDLVKEGVEDALPMAQNDYPFEWCAGHSERSEESMGRPFDYAQGDEIRCFDKLSMT